MKKLIYLIFIVFTIFITPVYAKNMEDSVLKYSAKMRLILKPNLSTSKLNVHVNNFLISKQVK